MSLQKYPSQKPITALLPTTPLDNKSLLFSSQGFNLRIHTRPLNNLIFSQQIFKHQIIHGITRLNYSRPLTSGDAGKHCSEEILIHGGRWIRRARFAFSYLTGDFEAVWSILGEEVECEDWILDVVRFSGRSAAVGVTAHDDLVLLSWELEGSFNQIIGPTRTRVVGRGSRSILYAAHLLWDRSKSGHETEDRLIIAGGTAFGQILVQTATFGAGHEEEVLIETRYVVSGHEGSIFGVRLSGPLIQSDGTKLRFLSSCSDDRTVRVWDVTDLNPTIARGWIDEQVTGTGFQATTTKVSLATGIGHISRVWSLRYVYLTQEPQQNLLVKIVSAGEDGTCRLWSLRTQHGQYTLEADDIISEHCGKNIWSLEVASTSKKDNHFDVITGGADGAILAATISTDSVTSLVPTLKAWTVQDALDSALDMKLQKSQKQCFRAMTLLQDSAILVATENGDILLAKPVASTNYVEKEFQWNHIAQADTFRGYSIASATPDKAVAVIADASGSIYFYRAKTQEFRLILESTSSKVSGLWIEEWDNETLGTTDLVLLAFDLGTKQARISFIREKVVSTGISRHINTWCIDIGQAIVVAAACHSEGGYTLLAIGFRDGAIKIYQHMNESGSRSSPFESTNPESSYSPLASITNCEKESITKLTWIITSTTKYLCSTARDGHFTIHSISSSTASVTVLHKLLLPFTPNIEGFWFCPITSHLVIYGFHSTNLIIYNVSTSHEIASIPCGGAHRTWSLDLSSSLSPETGRVITQAVFAWTQVNTLRTVTVSDAHNAVVQQGGHGRDIKTCAIAPIPFDTHTNLRKDYLIATGAEDTNIHLSIPAPSDADFTILATIRKHNTGVRHLQWSSDGKRVFSSAGKEEFCVWRVTALPMKGLSIGVYCESMVPVEGGVSDLRILAFDVTALPGNQEEDERFAITLGYSNSMIKTFEYSIINNTPTWKLLATRRYTSACITHLSHLPLPFLPEPQVPAVLSTSTDGSIILWPPLPSSTTPPDPDTQHPLLLAHSLHQNAITASSLFPLLTSKTHDKQQQHTYLCITGGDDGGLGITLFTYPSQSDRETQLVRRRSIIIPRAHAAAITGLLVTSSANRGEVMVISTGLDQRVRKWVVSLSSPGSSATDTGDVMSVGSEMEEISVRRFAGETGWTSISDPAGLVSMPSEDGEALMMIYGVGLEIRSVDESNK